MSDMLLDQCFSNFTSSSTPRPRLRGSMFTGVTDNTPKAFDYDEFSVLAQDLVQRGHDVRNEKDGFAISLVEYPPGTTRCNENVKSIHGAGLDFDSISEAQLQDIRRAFSPYGYLIYTTFSDCPGLRCVRLLVPFESPVSREEYPAYWRSLNDLAGGLLDPSTKEPARVSYLPAHPPGAIGAFLEHHYAAVGGAPVTAQAVTRHFGRRDLSTSSRQMLGLSKFPVHGAVDARSILARRFKKSDPELGNPVHAVLAGEEFAEPGIRDTLLYRMLCSIFARCPELDVEDVVPLFDLSIRVMAATNPAGHLTMEDVREKAVRAEALRPVTRILRRGDEAEIGELLVEDLARGLEQAPIFDVGAIYRYNSDTGVWTAVERSVESQLIQGYALTCKVTGSADKPPHQLKVSDKVVCGSISLAHDRVAHSGFFAASRAGVAFENGFVSNKNGTIVTEPHSPANRVTFALPFPYAPGTTHPYWDHFLSSIFLGDSDAQQKVDALQEYIGACLFGIATRYHKVLVLVGDGRNGKSVFIKVISALFPETARSSIAPQLWEQEYRRATLIGKLVNLVAELPRGDILKSEAFKAITSGDEIDGRMPYGRPLKIRPIAGHIFAANQLPGVDDQTPAFWERLLIVEFNRRFKQTDQIKDFDKLIIHNDLAAIAPWAVEGARRLLSRISGAYTEPGSHRSALESWKLNADQVMQWVEARTSPAGKNWLAASTAYQDYRMWAAENGHRQLAQNKFGQRLRQLGKEFGFATKKPGTQTLYELSLNGGALGGFFRSP